MPVIVLDGVVGNPPPLNPVVTESGESIVVSLQPSVPGYTQEPVAEPAQIVDLQDESDLDVTPAAEEPPIELEPALLALVKTISSLIDVDLTNLEHDSLLLWKTDSQKWEASKRLETHFIESGQY